MSAVALWQQVSALGIVAVLGTQGAGVGGSASDGPDGPEGAAAPASAPVRRAEADRRPALVVSVSLPDPVGIGLGVTIRFGDCAPPKPPAIPPVPPAPQPPAPEPPEPPSVSEPPAPEPPSVPRPPRPEPPVPAPAGGPPSSPAPPAPPAPPPPPDEPPPAAAPPTARAVAVRPYRPASRGPEADGTPLTVLMLVTTVPAVLAAAMLRPRSTSAARRSRA